MSRPVLLTALFLAMCALFIGAVFSQAARSSDLMAIWMAGVFLKSGQSDQIYFLQEAMFSMRVHESWIAYLQERFGYEQAVFPFIYPPLWAWLAQPLSDQDVFALMRGTVWVNAALLMGCVFLGVQLSGGSRILALAFAVPALLFTQIGAIALYENQPQVLVSFLILLAIERNKAGAGHVAGAAMALAAAIKLYPAALALLWLARRDWPALRAFAVVGCALGLLSLATTGWPLHAAFLEQLGNVSASTLITATNWNVHGLLAQSYWPNALLFVDATQFVPDASAPRGWWVLQKGAVWTAFTTAAPLLVIAGAFRGFEAPTANHWGAVLTAMALLAPIGWAYYYIPTIVLAPAIWRRLGIWGAVATVGLTALLLIPIVGSFRPLGAVDQGIQLAGTYVMGCFCALFCAAAWGRD